MPALSLAHGIESNRANGLKKTAIRNRLNPFHYGASAEPHRQVPRTAPHRPSPYRRSSFSSQAARSRHPRRKGGSVTAKRGSAYFRKLAARRKTHGGGGPRKESN
jgi:hypothetical protein